jgi:hypothetical protein
MSADMTMRCEDVAPYLSAYADHELPEPLRSEVAEHVATCESCSATLARYATIDTLFAALPRSAPPPEALDQILSAIALEDDQAERRRAMRSTWSLAPIKRVMTQLDLPQADTPAPRRWGPTQRARWISIAIPAIAAALLISVTLVSFHWLPSKGPVFTNQPTPPPAPGSQTLKDTRTTVSAIQAQLAFKPILPTYLPDGATLYDVTIGPRDADINGHVLDIKWSLGDSVHMIHLREAPSKLGLTGYTAMFGSNLMSWQIGNAPWRQMRFDAEPTNMAIGQQRAGVAIGLDVAATTDGPASAAGQTVLRLISLSMDSTYLSMPAAPDEGNARILPISIQDMVAHYSAVALNGTGSTQWREEVYVAPCASTAQPCQVRKTYSWGANGPPLYTDISSGQRQLHLDEAQKSYSWLPLLPSDQGADLNSTALPKLFFLGNTYLSSGILWYMGETTFKGQRVFNLLWTNAPTRTHVYVSVATHQAVAMVVESRAKILNSGPIAGTGARSCLRYLSLEYVAPSPATEALFAQSIPQDFTANQESPIELSC